LDRFKAGSVKHTEKKGKSRVEALHPDFLSSEVLR